MAKYNLKWSFGNEKLQKTDTVSFNIPAFRSADGFHTCPKAGACATLCYARQGRYMMPNVARAREFNLEKVRGDLNDFRRMAIDDLRLIRNGIVRVHDSGDFFSQDYMDAWFDIAGEFPQKKFYAYTKSLHLDRGRKPDNFQIIQSVGGLMDAEIDPTESHSRIFKSHYSRRKAGYVNGNKDDSPAINGETRIGLVYHGTRNLKEGQKRWLDANEV
jgi:protein gp88